MWYQKIWNHLSDSWDFPGSWTDKESTCNVGDMGLIPGLGRSPGGGHGNPLQYSCLENPHGHSSLGDYSLWGWKELDTTEWLSAAPRNPASDLQPVSPGLLWRLWGAGSSSSWSRYTSSVPHCLREGVLPRGDFSELQCCFCPFLHCNVHSWNENFWHLSAKSQSNKQLVEEGRAPGEPFWCLERRGCCKAKRTVCAWWGAGLEAPGYSRLPDSPASLSKLLGFTFTSASSPPHPHIPTSAQLKSLPTGEVWLPPYGVSFSHLSGIVWAGSLLMSRVSPEQGLWLQEWLRRWWCLQIVGWGMGGGPEDGGELRMLCRCCCREREREGEREVPGTSWLSTSRSLLPAPFLSFHSSPSYDAETASTSLELSASPLFLALLCPVFEAHSEAVSIFSSYSTSAFGVSMRTAERHVVPAAPSSLHFALELTVPLPPCSSKPSPVVFWVSLLWQLQILFLLPFCGGSLAFH